ncbi:MAG TPA: DUF2630 family protein [Acidimicrobiia bacterium]|nr:DUF2630 family protein [Acidimicrobiia bacterium]
MDRSDPGILSRIGELVEREKELRNRTPETALTDEERIRLEEVEGELDQCWDLLNQRRALREFDMDPDGAAVRDEEIVEDYQQ